MKKPTVPNKVIDSDTGGELWFMAYQKLSDSQVLLLLKIDLGMGRKFPTGKRVLKVDTKELGFVSPSPASDQRRRLAPAVPAAR